MWWTLVGAVLTITIAYVVRKAFFEPNKKPGGATHERKGLLYWWRWFWRLCEVWIEQLLTQPRMNNFDLSGSSYYTCGLLATPSEQDLEMPKPLLTDRHEDSMYLFGMDKDGRAVVATVVRLTQRRASMILSVVDDKGDIYTLPGQPDTNYINVTDSGWRAGGLVIECVDPMKCWRLKFNGLLRRGARDEYITEDDKDSDDEHIIHARLDLLWHAIRPPVDVWRDSSPILLARALANQSRIDASSSLFSLVDNMSLERDEYEQWGSLRGEIRLGGQPSDPPQVWCLRGNRRHRWGLSKSIANFHRSVEFFNYFTNGDVCSLQACSYGTKMSHYVLGYMQKANGDYHPITYTNLSLSSLAEKDILPHNILVKLTAGGQSYDLWHKLGQGMTVHSGDPWSLTHKINFNHVATNHSHGWGLSVYSDRFTDLCPVPELECLPPLDEPQLEVDETSPLVVGISDYLCRATCLTGGKGASLGQLALLKDMSYHPFEVPEGIVVTVSAWQRQLRTYSVLQQAVRGIEKAVSSSSQQQLKDACAKAVDVFRQVTICQVLQGALKNIIEEEFDNGFTGRRFAVRSSGCSEDGEESSAAGQNETLLGVEGFEGVLTALASCWASQFTFQSVEYRRQRGQPVNGGMAVVVQEMVNAEVAGVLFTHDPVTGSPANVTITANYGLGESVVSAAAEPDTIIVRRTWRDNLSVASATTGAKKTKFILNENGGTSEVPVDENEQNQVCLSNSMSLHLANVALYLQKAYGSPRDIEFAVVKETLYLLQARPVTGLESWTDFELTHEQDAGLLTDQELLTKSNTGEVFPGATSPLTVSLIPRILEVGYQRLEWLSMKFSPHIIRLTPCVSNHVFINLIEVMYRLNEDKKSVSTAAADLSLHGSHVTTPEYKRLGEERFGFSNPIRVMLLLSAAIYARLTTGSRVEKSRQQFGKFDVGQDRATSAEILYSEITRRLPDLLQVSKHHSTTSKLSSMTQTILLIMLAEENTELSDENQKDLSSLLSSCSGVESADVPSALKQLAQVIGENDEVNDFLGMTYEEGKVWLESHPGLVGTAYRAFLAKHGHRCIKELDLISRSWGLDPRPLVESLQAMVRCSSSSRSPREEITIEDAVNNLQTQIKETTKKSLKFLTPICRDAVVQREATKSLLTKVIDGFRKAYLKLGQLMVSEARLPDSELIFFLKHQEIGQLIKNRSPVIISKAVRRRRLHAHLDSLTFPLISMGIPEPISDPSSGYDATDGCDLVLTGTTVYQGVTKATARVVTKLSDANTIQNGDILVTKSTDVGWTPYFPLLSGIITEIGGLISHGAVVAREYGLPCLVGVTAATHLLKSGDTIVLDSIKGTITRIAAENSEDELNATVDSN